MSIAQSTDTARTAHSALMARVELEVHMPADDARDGERTSMLLTVARDGVVHAVYVPAGRDIIDGRGVAIGAYTVYAADGTVIADLVGLTEAQATAAGHTLIAAAEAREAARDAEFVVAEGGVEVPVQRPASVMDEVAAAPGWEVPAAGDQVAAARAVAVALGVEVGASIDLTDVAPGVDTVYLVHGGTRSRGELAAAPFVAVATRDEHSAWVAAADLVAKGGARVDALPLL